MKWLDWQRHIEDAHVIIYYDQFKDLYPMTEWLHPGALPIGTGLIDDRRQDLPNLDWLIRHLAWLGFREITVVSEESYKGLDLFYEYHFDELNIKFKHEKLINIVCDLSLTDFGDLVILSGHIPTNADIRHSLLLHRQRENNASMLSIRGLKFRIGIASINDENEIYEFKEKPLERKHLVNSNIIILDTECESIDQILRELESQLGNGSNFGLLRDKLIDSQLLKSVELTGVMGDPWFVDLSELERWVKLNFDDFIDHFSHLYRLDEDETNRD